MGNPIHETNKSINNLRQDTWSPIVYVEENAMGIFGPKKKNNMNIFTVTSNSMDTGDNKEDVEGEDVIEEQETKQPLVEESEKQKEEVVKEEPKKTEKLKEAVKENPNCLDNGEYLYSLNNGEVTIHKYLGNENSIHIPNYIDKCKVVKIAGLNNKGIINTKEQKVVKVKLPQFLHEIGAFSFYGCKDIETINFPDELETIGNSAFSYCLSLSDLIIPANIKTIEKNAFKCCTNLSRITIEGLDTNIEDANVFETKNQKTIIYGHVGSKIETFANSNNLSFKKLTITKITAEYTGFNLNIGEEINLHDLKVDAFWNNGVKVRLSSNDFAVSDQSFEASGNNQTTITYDYEDKHLKTNVSIFVKGRILEEITVIYAGEPVTRETSLDKNDVIVRAVYDDNTSERVFDFIIDDNVIHEVGENTITVIYDSQFATCTVEGIKEKITKLDIDFLNNDFRLNDKLKKEDFQILAFYNNDTSNIIDDFELGKIEFEKEGLNELEIKVGEYTEIFTINVLPYKQISFPDFLKFAGVKELDVNDNITLKPLNLAIQFKSETEFIITYEEDGVRKTVEIS
jgi:hypothetical protein